MKQPAIQPGTRFGAFALDSFVSVMAIAALSVPLFSASAAVPVQELHGPGLHIPGDSAAWYLFAIGFALMLAKDTIGARSLAKRALKMQVVDAKTGAPANPLRCVLRNCTFFLAPFEALLLLTHPTQRLGDRLARTRVAVYDPAQEPQHPVLDGLLAMILAFCVAIACVKGVPALWPESKPPYSETSFNLARSATLTKQLYDSSRGGVRCHVLAYDSSYGRKIPYVSVVLLFEENYLADTASTRFIEERVSDLLRPTFPDGDYTGALYLYYRADNAILTRSSGLGHYMNDGGYRPSL